VAEAVRGRQSIWSLLAAQAEAAPDRLSIEAADAQLTHRQTRDGADAVARGLVALGMGPSECVAKVKQAFVACGQGRVTVLDSLGSSEAIGIAPSTEDGSGDASSNGGVPGGGPRGFRLSASARVLDEQGRDVVPGSGSAGKLAIKGRGPLGHYRPGPHDAETFATIDGERGVIPGDFAVIEADGPVRLLGRGSSSINTGGEKVFPEEVEDALRNHHDVVDAGVIVLPDTQFGEVVSTLLEVDSRSAVTAKSVAAEMREQLAAYKTPRNIVVAARMPRHQNGKLDRDAESLDGTPSELASDRADPASRGMDARPTSTDRSLL
jgi:acyl-CoA synthetase (AMP-forming)/AMP-acid ligase II